MQRVAFLIVAMMGFGWSVAVSAERLEEKDLPAELKPWVDWSLQGDQTYHCPIDSFGERYGCFDASEMTLELDTHGGSFGIEYRLHQKAWVPIPGTSDSWPLDVKTDGKEEPIAVIKNVPSILLDKGQHKISGKFVWNRLPEKLAVPLPIARIKLVVGGKSVNPIQRDKDGVVKLSTYHENSNKDAQPTDSETLFVMRKLIDDVPMRIETLVKLEISGRTRELNLRGALLPYGDLMDYGSALPLRMDPDPIVLVKPGQHEVRFVQLVYEPRTTFPLQATVEGVSEEIWTLEVRPQLRQIKVVKPESIDARNTHLPQDWKALPAYLMIPTQALEIEIVRVGQDVSDPNDLSLKRELWLDFDGGGYSIRDLVSGTINRDFRLNLRAPYELGRVAIQGEDQYITVADEGARGVEVRTRQLNLSAESRLGSAGRAKSLGWDQDFRSVSGVLNIPPGWRVWHGTGMDALRGAWINQWTLFDLFMVFIIVQAIFKLWGWRYAAVAAIAISLTWHEPQAPHWIWLALIAGKAVALVVREGVFFKINAFYRYASIGAFSLVVLPFLISYVRNNLYPQLDKSFSGASFRVQQTQSGAVQSDDIDQLDSQQNEVAEENVLPAPAAMAPVQQKAKADESYGKVRRELSKSKSYGTNKNQKAFVQKDPSLIVQTGLGLPDWNWRQMTLVWDGPVAQSQAWSIYVTPPWFNRIVAMVCSALWLVILTMAFEMIFDRKAAKKIGFRLNFFSKNVVLLLLAWSAVSLPRSASAEIPSKEMLHEIKERLTSWPSCFNQCGQIEEAKIDAGVQDLTITLTAHAAYPLYLPLPMEQEGVIIDEVLLGKEALRFFYTSNLDRGIAVYLPYGSHEVVLKGRLTANKASLMFPSVPHHVTIKAEGWEASGVEDHTMQSSHILLTRNTKDSASPEKDKFTGTAAQLPPHFKIERAVRFDLDWRITTTITREGQSRDPVNVLISLLPDEAIVTESVKRQGDQAVVEFGREEERSFDSILKMEEHLRFKASNTPRTHENWIFVISPLWHVSFEGIAPTVQQPQGSWSPAWSPWPGEELNLTITKPKGADGQSVTIDSSQLTLTPGKRSTDGELSFNLRTSRSGRHTITFASGVELQNFMINGVVQNIKLKNNQLTFPIQSGPQKVAIKFREDRGISNMYTTSAIDLGVTNVNHTLVVNMPERWTLWTHGPILGPAVLFWGELIVLLVLAVALGRIHVWPLRTHHWVLLALGTANIDFYATAGLIIWFGVVALKQRFHASFKGWYFNLAQLVVLAAANTALGIIYVVLLTGLMSEPNMVIRGFESTSHALRWFQDRNGTLLPTSFVMSVPILVYRGFMLAWALWFAYATSRWVRWIWEAFSAGGLFYRPAPKPSVEKEPKQAAEKPPQSPF